MLKNPLTYEIMTPKSVGVPDSKLVLGKHSGRHALGLRCEQLGYQFDRRELDEVYRRFVVLADRSSMWRIIICWNSSAAKLHRSAPFRADGKPAKVAAAAAAATARHTSLFPRLRLSDLSAATVLPLSEPASRSIMASRTIISGECKSAFPAVVDATPVRCPRNQ